MQENVRRSVNSKLGRAIIREQEIRGRVKSRVGNLNMSSLGNNVERVKHTVYTLQAERGKLSPSVRGQYDVEREHDGVCDGCWEL